MMDPVRPRTVLGVAAALPLIAVLGLYLGSRDTMLPYEDEPEPPTSGGGAALTQNVGRPMEAVPIAEPASSAPAAEIAQNAAKAKSPKNDDDQSSADAQADSQPVEAPASAPPELETPAAPPATRAQGDDTNTPPY